MATSFIATILHRPLPRPAQHTTGSPIPTEDHSYISTNILTSFRHLCTASHLSIPAESILPLDQLELPRVIQCELIDPSGHGSNVAKLKKSDKLREFEYSFNVDVALQPNTVWRKHKRLVVFDMDSTLIQQEVIDEIAAFVGVKKEVAVRIYIPIPTMRHA